MDKDIILSKLQEGLTFIICVAIILAIAYFSGFLKGFTPADFRDAYQQLLAGFKTGSFATTKLDTKYGNYRANKIPDAAFESAKNRYFWRNIFYSNKKVIFYIHENDSFHKNLQNYLSKGNGRYYTYLPYSQSYFNNVKLGEIGPNKICNSIQECNAQRKRALNESLTTDFLSKCGRTMCIINPPKKQYIRLKTRDYGAAVKLINDLRGW